jgi:hypothetical protein
VLAKRFGRVATEGIEIDQRVIDAFATELSGWIEECARLQARTGFHAKEAERLQYLVDKVGDNGPDGPSSIFENYHPLDGDLRAVIDAKIAKTKDEGRQG